MQNIDFYSGPASRDVPLQFDSNDPEYFSRMSGVHSRDQEKAKKKASRVIFLISALCIICFTTGLVIGIKFAGGSKTPIVDDATYRAMNDISQRVSGLVKPAIAAAVDKSQGFPASQYPYALKIGESYKEARAREIASFLSKKGHTVILSHAKNGEFRVFTGPYKTRNNAKSSLKKLDSYNKFSISATARIVKRN